MGIFETDLILNLTKKHMHKKKITYETSSPFFLFEHIYLGHRVGEAASLWFPWKEPRHDIHNRAAWQMDSHPW